MKTIKIWMISLLMMVGLTNIVNAGINTFFSTATYNKTIVEAEETLEITITLRNVDLSPVTDANPQLEFKKSNGDIVTELNIVSTEHTGNVYKLFVKRTNTETNEAITITPYGNYDDADWTLESKVITFKKRGVPKVGAINLDNSSIVAGKGQVISDSVDSTTITVTLHDEDNNPIKNATIAPSQSYNGSATESIIGEIVNHNDGTYTFNVRSNTVEQVAYSVAATATYGVNHQTSTETIAQEDDEATVSFVPSETFTTGSPYAKNSSKTHTLGIPGASALNVKIVGETEDGVDTIVIKDMQGHKTKYSGILTEEFTVEGDMIDVSFMSDGSIEKSGVTVTVSSSTVGKTRFETAHPYQNNTHSEETLSISGANRLKVTIDGEVENKYDYITIVDASGQETRLTGVLSKELTVNGDHIKVKFDSDYSVVKNGATVQIEALN